MTEMGLPASNAIGMLLTSIAADKTLPFDVNRSVSQVGASHHEIAFAFIKRRFSVLWLYCIMDANAKI